MVPVIAFSGPAGVGKTTAAEIVNWRGYVTVKFAGPLKNMMRSYFETMGISPDDIERMVEGGLKEVPTALLAMRTPRFAMQTIGTEWGRDTMAEDFWVNAWEQTVSRLVADGHVVVCDDCRFQNEADAIRRLGGIVIGLTGRDHGISGSGHASEAFDFEPDYVLDNRGSVQQLSEAIDDLLAWLNANLGQGTDLFAYRGDDTEEAFEAEIEEVATRIHSATDADEATSILRAFMNGEIDEADEPSLEELREQAKTEARAWLESCHIQDKSKRREAFKYELDLHGGGPVAVLDDEMALKNLLWFLEVNKNWKPENGDPIHTDGTPCAIPTVVWSVKHVGRSTETAAHDVEVRPGVSCEELQDAVAAFLRGDNYNRKVEVYNEMRDHLGSFQISGYDQMQRTALRFYIDCRQAGCNASLRTLDDVLSRLVGGEQ